MKLYRLRDMSNGKYSSGESEPSWDAAEGKLWMKLGELKEHLAAWAENNNLPVSPFWEVIEMDVTEAQAYPAIAIMGKK